MLGGGPALAPPTTGDVELLKLQVDGMGCEACQLHVRGVIERSGGVIGSAVDFKKGTAEILVAKGWSFDAHALSARLEEDGYSLVLPDADGHSGAATAAKEQHPADDDDDPP